MLKELREELLRAIAEGADLDKVLSAVEAWFKALKEWEALETFERAFTDNRMTARCIDTKGTIKTFSVKNEKGVQSPMNVDSGKAGLDARLEPKNFLAKLKNELGLHDLATALLVKGKALSMQLFKVSDGVIFMPLPLEEDLQALFLVSTLAKKNRNSALYNRYVEIRAEITRIKYGSDNDMTLGFLNITKMTPDSAPDGKQHIRYGMATITGAQVNDKILKLRIQNALNYKTAIAASKKTEENNEVTIAYRKHAGPFPMLGFPTSVKGQFNLLNTAKVGTLNDNGSVTYI